MLTDLQKRAAQAIVNVFETGRVLGDYASVTLLTGDAGQLTYGRSQTTLASGNLHLLIKAYCDEPAAALGAGLRPFLDALQHRDPALNQNMAFRTLLRDAGADPVMHDCQDRFFDRVYWTPATLFAAELGIASALGTATIYDSVVHGSWRMIRDQTSAAAGAASAIGERKWVAAYIATRRGWLGGHSNELLRRTAYRMDALQELVDAGRWALPLPFAVRGRTIDEAALLAGAEIRVSAQLVEERHLRLRTPFMEGEDVKALQRALASRGFAVEPDGVFGNRTHEAVVAFQTRAGMVADGIAGPATRAALGL